MILKRIVGLLLVVVLGIAASFSDIYTSLKSGNAQELAKFFDERLLLTIKGGGFDVQNTYSKAQAKGILKDFFSKTDPNKFEEKHKNDNDNKPLYRIGYLTTKSGTYRTLIRVKQVEGAIKIQEIELSLDKSVK